jgi:hypothetical protein
MSRRRNPGSEALNILGTARACWGVFPKGRQAQGSGSDDSLQLIAIFQLRIPNHKSEFMACKEPLSPFVAASGLIRPTNRRLTRCSLGLMVEFEA